MSDDCFTMGHFCAKILSDGIVLQLRSIAVCDASEGLQTQNYLDKPFKVLAESQVAVMPTLELVVVNPLKTKIEEESAALYAVFYQQRLDVVCIPEWFPMIMFAKKDNVFEITNKNNVVSSQIKVKAPDFFVNKFDIIADVTQ